MDSSEPLLARHGRRSVFLYAGSSIFHIAGTTSMPLDQDVEVYEEEDGISCVQNEHFQTDQGLTSPQLPLPQTMSSTRWSMIWPVIRRHFARHAGAGIMASVAYFDP